MHSHMHGIHIQAQSNPYIHMCMNMHTTVPYIRESNIHVHSIAFYRCVHMYTQHSHTCMHITYPLSPTYMHM